MIKRKGCKLWLIAQFAAEGFYRKGFSSVRKSAGTGLAG